MKEFNVIQVNNNGTKEWVLVLNKTNTQFNVEGHINYWVVYKPGLMYTLVEDLKFVKFEGTTITHKHYYIGQDIAKISCPEFDTKIINTLTTKK